SSPCVTSTRSVHTPAASSGRTLKGCPTTCSPTSPRWPRRTVHTSKCSATTTTPPTAPRSVTTCTCWTWPAATWPQSPTWPTRTGAACTTSVPGGEPPSWNVCAPSRRPPGSPSPSRSSSAAPVTSPPATPTRPPPPTTWDGRHNTPWPRHAPTPGVGRSTTPEALPAEPAPHTALSRGTQENPRRTGSSLAFNLLVWLQGVPGCPFCSSWAPRAGEHGACSACPQDALDPAWKVSVHPRIPAGQRGCTETPDAPAMDSSAPAPQAGARADAPERPAPEPTATGCRPRPPARTTGPPLADPATGA